MLAEKPLPTANDDVAGLAEAKRVANFATSKLRLRIGNLSLYWDRSIRPNTSWCALASQTMPPLSATAVMKESRGCLVLMGRLIGVHEFG